MGAWPRRRAAAGGGDCGGGAARLDGGPGFGEKGEGTSGVLLLPLPWEEVAQGGGSAVAGGAPRLWWAVAALGARGGARGGESGGGGRELREGPTYRPGEAVERAGLVAGWRAPRTAINGARGVVERRGA